MNTLNHSGENTDEVLGRKGQSILTATDLSANDLSDLTKLPKKFHKQPQGQSEM
jgi:hypothetical protein